MPMPAASREFILSEIQRVASELGHAPGKREFFNLAGLKESDWQGRYWARWSDAVREAGFEANLLKSAHSEEHLIESLVSLIREVGRFPTRPEMRMKRRADTSFPDPNTFRRFGLRAGIVERVRQYCEGRPGYEDALEACVGAQSEKSPRDSGSESESVVFGFVYLIKSGRHYKIGRSNAVGRRERELAIQLPERSTTTHVIRTDDPVGIERYWHQRFESKRKNGEWFELEPADVAAFRRRKFM